MKVFTCKDRLEDIMTCIYDAWSEALQIGHDQIQLKKEPIFQQTIFDEYIHVDQDTSKAEKVIRSIRRDISDEAYLDIYLATLSAEEDALQAIYNFLRVGFSMGGNALKQYANPHVMRILELRRKVSNESHHFREFTRFEKLNSSNVYVSHLEPKSDVIMLVGRHFVNRMPSEQWMIIDDNRKTACVHPKDGENYLRYLTDEEFQTLRKTEELKEEYPDRKIIVVDSLCASLGEGLFVYKAVQMKEAGASMEEVAAWLEEHKQNFCHVFTVDDLFHLYRGGRVSKAAAIVGTMINLKPLLHVDDEGHLIPLSKVRGRKKSLATLVSMMEERIGSWKDKNDIIFISHGDCEEDAQYVAKLVREKFGYESFLINTIGATIGTHSGPGTVALFFMGEYR